LLALALVLAGVLGGGAAGVRQAEADTSTATACRESFARVKRAFESASAEAVVACMQPEGTLALTLIGASARPDPMKREQAQRVLKGYFEAVSGLKLVERPGQPAESLVRAYDYTRRLRSGDPATTRLTVTLRKDATGELRLQSIIESAR
jgi:hypothetical protein